MADGPLNYDALLAEEEAAYIRNLKILDTKVRLRVSRAPQRGPFHSNAVARLWRGWRLLAGPMGAHLLPRIVANT